ncbi:isochorismatase family protein [Streptomyces sp. NPDC050423]|uniref:isochorismatase family protein n=1 Tax=Streptomyces sp. NPDC050423 TaxID=3155402 RepID=UPI00344956EB
MGLPVIESYEMPDGTALPRSWPSWTIDPGRAALLVHDMQNHFVRAFPAGRSPVVQLVENIATLRELAGTLGIPVVFSAEPAAQSPGGRGLVADVWGPGIGDGPGDSAVIEALAPRPGEHVLPKCAPHRLSAQPSRPAAALDGPRSADRVRRALGVLLTAADAFMNDIQPFVVADAVADFSAEEHSMALRWAARSAVVRTTDGLLRDLLLGRVHHDA